MIEDVGPPAGWRIWPAQSSAREIDATGKLVMPAFVDADMALVMPAPLKGRVMADARLRFRAADDVAASGFRRGAAAMAAEWARYGCLTVGAHTGCAADMQNIGKVLRTHQALQSKPLRIRSIFSPVIPNDAGKSRALSVETVISKWLPAVRAKKLASVMELRSGDGFDG